MKDISVSVANECHNSLTVTLFASIPLFKFDDHCIVVEKFVSPREQAVQPLGRKWELVFE
jgi:hypothetical protein